MPRVSEMIPSKYLKVADVPDPIIVTFSAIRQEDLAMEGKKPQLEWCAEFAELDKLMVLKPTNLHLAETILGSDDTDNWIGKEIVIWADPTISFGGKVVGGLRFRGSERKPVRPPARPAPMPAAVADTTEEDIPF